MTNDPGYNLRAGDAAALLEGTPGNVLTFLADGSVGGRPPAGGGGSFPPTQQKLFVDNAAAPATPNGSIAAPFTTWAAAIAAMQVDHTGTWQVLLPAGPTDLTATGSLSGIQAIVLTGTDPAASFGGDFAPLHDGAGQPNWVLQDMQFDSVAFHSAPWGDLSLENCQMTHLIIDTGNSFTVLARDSTISDVQAGSVGSNMRFENCRVGNIQSSGVIQYVGCTVSGTANMEFDNDGRFLACVFGANVTIPSPIHADRSSEVSLLSNGGTCVEITSLDGDGPALPLPNSNAGLDFSSVITRAYLEATTLTGNVVKPIAVTGGVPMQTFTIDNYNTTGFTCTIQTGGGPTTLAVIGNERKRYVFQIDAAGTAVTLLSVTNIGS